MSQLAALASVAEETGARVDVVEVVARGLEFSAPSELPAGWTRFRFMNASAMVHFALIERLPPGHDLDAQQQQVAPIFQQGMDLLNAGDEAAAMAKFGELPPWFADIEFLGGPGLLAPGRSAITNVYLEPGNYLFECYVKTDGVFHSYNPQPGAYGMVLPFRVLPRPAARPQPSASVKVTLSATEGIVVQGAPVVGEQIIAVHFADQRVHENFVGHDLHLARLDADTDLAALEAWMDWRASDGLQSPAPVQFLGGVNEMPAGSTAYLELRLEPGSYAWIAEVPGAAAKGMLKVFTLAPASR